MVNDSHDWRPLSYICYDLERLDHPLHFGFTFRPNRENAIANATRSRKVPVRGRRGNGYDCIPQFGSEFERIEQYLGPKAGVDILLNRIIIPPSAEFRLWPHMNAGILPALAVAYDDGPTGNFVEVEADSRAVEKWLRENAVPRGWQGAAAEEGTPTRRGPPPKYAWDAIREEAFRLMNHHGDFSDDNPEWDRQARLEEELQLFYANKFGKDKEPSPSRLRDRDRIPCWLAEWRKPKEAVDN
jgi:hypothetical protein